MLVEQAIFASAQTASASGYQLLGASPGISAAERRELAQWCPTHDSLWSSTRDPCSVNFFRLASGAYCVSTSSAAPAEYSGRGGTHVQTHCCLVPPALLAKFSNNPFALLRAVTARTSDQIEPGSADLPTFHLAGSAALIDMSSLSQLVVSGGAAIVSRLVDAVLSGNRTLVRGATDPELLASGVISCLPLPARLELSFSTGLFPSQRRPFRMVWAPPGDRARSGEAMVVDLNEPPTSLGQPNGWAGFVLDALSVNNLSRLSAELKQLPLSLADDALFAKGEAARQRIAVGEGPRRISDPIYRNLSHKGTDVVTS